MGVGLATRGIISGVIGNIGIGGSCDYEDRIVTIEYAIEDIVLWLEAYVLKINFRQFVHSTGGDLEAISTLISSLESQINVLQDEIKDL